MVLLAAAYAPIEEGPVDQLLWNNSYAGEDLLRRLLYPWHRHECRADPDHPRAAPHMEYLRADRHRGAFVPHRRAEPWLGRVGLTVVGVVYALGAGLVFWGNYYEERFLASPGQLSGIGIVIVALVMAAYVIKGRGLPRCAGSAP